MKPATSHKDVSGFALLPSFLAGATTAFFALGLCTGVAAKFVEEEWKTPIKLSFVESLTVPKVQLANDTETEKQTILDNLVIKRRQYRKFVTNNRRVPGAPLPAIVTSKAAPVLAHQVIPVSSVALKKKTEQIVTERVRPQRQEVYSALEEAVPFQNVESPKQEDEYSKMLSLRNTFVASLLGDMTTHESTQEFVLPQEQPETPPVINQVQNEIPVVAKRKKEFKKTLPIKRKVLAVIKPKKKAKRAVVELTKKLEVVQKAAPAVVASATVEDKPTSEKLVEQLEAQLKQEFKIVEYSKEETLSTQPVVEVMLKESKIGLITKQEEVPVVIEPTSLEVIQEYVEAPIAVAQAAPVKTREPELTVVQDNEIKEEPAPRVIQAQQRPEPLSEPIVKDTEEKKVTEPVVVAKAWTLPVVAPKVVQAEKPVIVTIRPKDPVATEVASQQVVPNKPMLPVIHQGLIAQNLKTELSVQVPALESNPLQVVEKSCNEKVCFERWLSTQNEKLDVQTLSLNKISTRADAKEWVISKEDRSIPTLYFGANYGRVPLINKSELELIHKNIDAEGFLLLRGHPEWSLVESQSLSEENTISLIERAPGDKLYTKVQPGMLLVRLLNKQTKKYASVAIPVMRGHVSFLDLSNPVERTATITLEKPLQQTLGVDWIGTETLVGVRSGQIESTVKLQMFGNYPANVDVKSADGFTHRHLVFPNKNQLKLKIEVLKDRQVERFLKMLEGGVSADSGMVYGKIPLQYIGNSIRLDPGRISKKLIPELYLFDGALNEEDQVLIPGALASAKLRNMVGVQVPKGLLLISLEKASGDRQALQLHLAQPGVVNVYQPE